MIYPAIKEVIQYTTCTLIWYLIIVEFVNNEREIWTLIRLISFASAFIAFLGILQFLVASIWHINILEPLIPLNKIDSKLWFSDISPRIRTTSLFLNPNALGSFLVLTAPLSLISFLYKRNSLFLILNIIVLLGIITNYSPGNFFGFIVSILIFSVLYFKRVRYSIYVTTIFLVSTVILSYVFYPSYFSHVLDYLKEAGSFRLLLWEETLRIFYKNPVWGIGLNNFWWQLSPWWKQHHNYLADPHNFILNLLVETGVVGTFCFFGFLGFTINRALTLRNNLLIWGLLAGIGGCLVTALFNSPAMFTRGTIFLFWFEVHLLIIYVRLNRLQARI
jgi:O-antigen ligase